MQTTPGSNFKTGNTENRLTTVLFVVYLVALCWILLFKLGVRFSYMESRSFNLIPFGGSSILHLENVLNVIIFVPLGIYAGVLFSRLIFVKHLLLFFFFSLIIEAVQYVFRIGAFDVTDIITNTAGGIIGLILFRVIEKTCNSSQKAQAIINIFAATGTALMIILLVLVKNEYAADQVSVTFTKYCNTQLCKKDQLEMMVSRRK